MVTVCLEKVLGVNAICYVRKRPCL